MRAVLFGVGVWLLATLVIRGVPARAAPSTRVAVQPVGGAPAAIGPALRAQIARLLRSHGYRVVTTIPGVDGTGQYLTLARERRLAAFVASDLEEHRTRQTLTILIWDGAQGSVLGRWSASGPAKQLGKQLAKGFWKHLGPVLERARAPESAVMAPAPPMRIDASAVD